MLGLLAWAITLGSIFFCATISAITGTGGGALYMPVLTLSLNDPHLAVPLSKSCIFGVALAAVSINLSVLKMRKSKIKSLEHDFVKKWVKDALILLPIAASFEPMTLAGATFGVISNLVMTSTQILMCLIVILTITTVKTFHKGIKQLKNERLYLMVENGDSMDNSSIHEPNSESAIQLKSYLHATRVPFETFSDSSLESIPLFEERDQVRRDEVVEQELKKLNFVSLFVIIASWTTGVLLLVCGGGPAAILCGNTSQKFYVALEVCCHFLLSIFFFFYTSNNQVWQEVLSLASMPSASKIAVLGPAAGFFSGLCAGCLGIGGGLIKGPVMIHLGLQPLQTVATTSFMILFTASTNMVSYAVSGRVSASSASVYIICAFTASVLGTWALHWWNRSNRRASYSTLFLASVILFSMIAMVGAPVYQYSTSPEGLESAELSDVCGRIQAEHKV
eukprot:GHVP01040845.1.p1 GENE.GHVP01040845.1~~GHVP01040845.1.p1  ORF type:complete len:450 (-),score=59.12 GHVP01040845.1:849-2198(-)